jgi:hypothetical protein
MLCFLRSFASVIWRKTSDCSIDCDNERVISAMDLRGLHIRKSGKIALLSLSLFLFGFNPISLLAQTVPAIPDISASEGLFLDIVRLTWVDVADETGYQVFRCATTDTGTCGDAIATLSADTTEYDDLNVFNIGGKHYYRLKSCNITGCSDFSSADIGYTQLIFGNGYEDAFSVPEAPTLNTATADDESAELTFTPNGDGGSAISGYTAKCGAITQNGPSSPITVTGLTNGVEYSCSVFATNEAGDSAPCSAILVTPIFPALITKFEVTTNKDPQPVSCGDTNITFEWEATHTDKCYGSWAESESNQEGSLFGSIDQQTGALYDTESVLFEDLALTKKFILRCENDIGETSQEESVSVKAPCLFTITKNWIDVFTREWPGPKTYRSDARITGDKAWAIKFNTGRVLSQTSTSSPITVTGMQRGARYSCSVVANNASGTSSPSNLLYFNPVEMLPEAPTLVSAEPGDRSAKLTFTDRGDLFATTAYQAQCGAITQTGSSSPITVNNLSNNADYFCSVTARNELGIGERSNQIAVSPQAPSLFVTSVKGGDGVFQASPGAPNTSATVPAAPTLISYELGHLSAELTFTDDDPDATSYTASCRISTAGGVGTIEYGSTRGERLLAISKLPGDFQVAEECREIQSLDGFLIWKTEGSDYDKTACELEPDTDYYWNITFTDGVNIGTSSCEAEGTPCQTYIRVVNPDTVN